MGAILYVISKLLRYLVMPFVFINNLYKEIKSIFSADGFEELNDSFLAKAILTDKLCNQEDAGLLTALFITEKSVHPFGNPLETISSVLGKNLLAGTLSEAGKAMCNILNEMQANHCINAIVNF